MTPKELAAQKLRNEYTDFYGRQTLYKAALTDPQNNHFDSENQNLFSGQALMFLHLNKLMTWKDIDMYRRGLESCKILPGLYSRYPVHYNTPDRHGISHDEMTGITIGCIAINESMIPNDMVHYGRKHNWIFIDENPDAQLFSPLSNFKKYISRVRQPKDRALYRLASGQKIGLFAKLNILLGSYLATRKTADHTSGRIMWFHKFKALEILGEDSKILKFARNLFNKKNTEVFDNEGWIEDCYKIYFEVGHPFHELVKGLRL